MSTLLLDSREARQLEAAAQLLTAGEAVALPTETVYGLAARVDRDEALARVFALKARPSFDPLIVHVLDRAQAAALVKPDDDSGAPLRRKLMDAFWPGPLTILFEKNPDRVSDLCTAGSPWVAVRSPAHPVFRDVLARVGVPLAAPSANRFGRISPTSAADVVTELGPFGLEAVVDGGPCDVGVESTVVRVVNAEEVEVLRPGAVSMERLRAVLGPKVTVGAAAPLIDLASPGTLASHYAPRTHLVFLESASGQDPMEFPVEVPAVIPSEAREHPERWSFLSVFPDDRAHALKWAHVRVLSAAGDDHEAAAKLFSTLRELDAAGLEGIVAVRGPELGLGLAINDRLRRAAGRGFGIIKEHA